MEVTSNNIFSCESTWSWSIFYFWPADAKNSVVILILIQYFWFFYQWLKTYLTTYFLKFQNIKTKNMEMAILKNSVRSLWITRYIKYLYFITIIVVILYRWNMVTFSSQVRQELQRRNPHLSYAQIMDLIHTTKDCAAREANQSVTATKPKPPQLSSSARGRVR